MDVEIDRDLLLLVKKWSRVWCQEQPNSSWYLTVTKIFIIGMQCDFAFSVLIAFIFSVIHLLQIHVAVFRFYITSLIIKETNE